MVRPENCQRCLKKFLQDDGYSVIYDNNGKPKEIICFGCSKNEQIFHYNRNKIITTSLMIQSYTFYSYAKEATEKFENIRQTTKEFWEANYNSFMEIHDAVKEIQIKSREFELKQWLGKIQNLYRKSKFRGHRGIGDGWIALLWGSAGRVLFTMQDDEDNSKFDGANLTLIFDETSNVARGGIQGINATKEQAIALLAQAINNLPKIKPNKKVGILT